VARFTQLKNGAKIIYCNKQKDLLMNIRKQKTEGKPAKAEPLTFHSGDNSYSIQFSDFGAGGVKIETYRTNAPWWDRYAACILPSFFIDALQVWFARTSGRAAMNLPYQILPVLKGLLAIHKSKIPKDDQKIIRQTIKSLEHLYNERSLSQRAFNR